MNSVRKVAMSSRICAAVRDEWDGSELDELACASAEVATTGNESSKTNDLTRVMGSVTREGTAGVTAVCPAEFEQTRVELVAFAPLWTIPEPFVPRPRYRANLLSTSNCASVTA